MEETVNVCVHQSQTLRPSAVTTASVPAGDLSTFVVCCH